MKATSRPDSALKTAAFRSAESDRRVMASANASVHVDGKTWQTDVSTVFVNTTQHFGKGMRAAPAARLDDGLCDVGSIAGSRAQSLRMFTLIKTGQHVALADSVQVT